MSIKELKSLCNNLTLLYVEDDINIQKTMSKYLKKLFVSVTLASDGKEGLVLAKAGKFDIIITDLSMPKMNGSDMIKAIREFNTKIPIVITTAHVDSDYLLEAIKTHVDGYIVKPFDYELLNDELYKVAEKIVKFKENFLYKHHLQDLLDKQTHEIEENYIKSIYSMVGLVEERDSYTAGHSKRVAFYCTLIAKEMHYSEEEVTLLHQAAILHDIGKIETPDSVLLNPNHLNDIEYKLIQEHVSVSYNFLNAIPMFQNLAEIVYEHHERYDGSGYPNARKGDEIHPLGRILILCDAFDAMTTNRIYKGRKSVSEALEELKRLSGKQFDPQVATAALVALKDIEVEENIDQLPKTKLEAERFAYFYRDTLSEIYNQSYLDVVLRKNSYSKDFNHLILFLIHGFSKFNEEKGWASGDIVLQEFAQTLETHFCEALAFRVFGDDFVLLSKNRLEISGMKKFLDKLMQKYQLSYDVKYMNLEEEKLEKLSDITFLRH